MTPATLRRLADQKIAEAHSLARDADLLRAQSSALRGLLDPLAAISQRVWTGPAAEDFEQQSAAQAQRVNGVAADLRRIAAELESRTRELRGRAAELRVQASRAELASAATGVV